MSAQRLGSVSSGAPQHHTIIRIAIEPYSVNRAVTRGCARGNIQPRSVMFIQRFGSTINETIQITSRRNCSCFMSQYSPQRLLF